MEKKNQLPVSSEGGGGDGVSYPAIVQRRQAIHAFLDDPEEAMRAYTELGDDLLIYFAKSTNPYLDDETGLPLKGKEEDFEKWVTAQAWARNYLLL